MPRRILALCLSAAVLILAACNLPTNVSGARTPLPTLTASATAVELTLAAATASPTPAPTATATPSASSSGSSTGGVLSTGSSGGGVIAPPCVVQTTWPVYTVVRGDTLSSIARRTGSTASVLAAANCLADPNRLEPGQVLRVPRVPPPPTPIPQEYPLPGEYGSLTAAPLENVESLPGGGTRLIVGTGITLTVRWLDYPVGGLTQAEIVYIPANPTQPAVSLGIDTNLSNGVTATWVVPYGAEGRLLASAPLPGQNHEFVYSPEVWVRAAAPVPTPAPQPGTYGTLRVVPALGTEPFDGTLRYRAQAGDNVSVIWEGFPAGLVQVEIVYIPLDRTAPAVSLGIDSALADGVSLAWSIPHGANGQLLASSRLPGQNHDMVYSPQIWVLDVNAPAP